MRSLDLLSFTVLCAITFNNDLQVSCESIKLKYKPDTFDDQYIGCSDIMEEEIIPKILKQEMLNEEFGSAWEKAKQHWMEGTHSNLPEGFKRPYGIALLVFTNDYPKTNPIHKQFNGNLSTAGISRDHYMNGFHFKSLHYYLTRALQILKPNCVEPKVTYRGSRDSFDVSPIFRFGRFTSASLNLDVAKIFGEESIFYINTCFGAEIYPFSIYPGEGEILIPVSEKFKYMKKYNELYILESTGQQCSYFNCAYLGEEKRDTAACYPNTTRSSEHEERVSVLEEMMSLKHEEIRVLEKEMSVVITSLKDVIQSVFNITGRTTSSDHEERLSDAEKVAVLNHEKIVVLQKEMSVVITSLMNLERDVSSIQAQHNLFYMDYFLQRINGNEELKKFEEGMNRMLKTVNKYSYKVSTLESKLMEANQSSARLQEIVQTLTAVREETITITWNSAALIAILILTNLSCLVIYRNK